MRWCATVLGLGLAVVAAPTTGGEAVLRRIEVAEPNVRSEVTCDIGDLIAAGRVSPRDAVSTVGGRRDGWLLRTPQSPPDFRWPRALLNAVPDAPPLVIDLQLAGTYDVYALVRAVDAGVDPAVKALLGDPAPMAFELALDDASQREIVGAKGFRDRHFDSEVLAGCGWSLTGRKLVVRSLGKPVYLYGFRFVPCESNTLPATSKAMRWLTTDHVTIVQEPDKHFAFPGAARLPDGELVVVYREGTVHETEAIGKVSLSRSRDGGRTWQPRVTALDRPESDDRDPSLFQMSDGTLALFSNDCVCTSCDGGRTWSPPRPTPVFGPKGGVEDEQGRLLYGGLQRMVQADFTRIHGAAAVLQADAVYRSPDKGVTWEPAGVATYTLYVPGRSDYVWYDEPFLCVVPNRFWIFAARVDLDGFARIIRSPDRGRTWEPVRKTPVWGFPQHLLPLRDGRLLMTYGYRRPPFGVRACLSTDCGETWDLANEVILRMDGGTPLGQARKVVDGDLGYPTSVQLADGTIFTVYYHNTAGSNCFIAGTFWKLPEIRP
jgi:hypothetical protein